MKKKAEGMSLRETFAIHRRAARDMRRIAPGCFMPFILCAVVEAASPYAVIWLSARLVDELSTLRRPEILAKWVLWIVAVSAAAELLKAVLERWKNVRSELLDRQKEVLYTEKFLRIKLLCRLYDPQEGQILLNGIDIRKYRYDDYMGIFSVVFQDFQLICQPLGANVAGSMEYDRDRARKALIDAGFADRLAAMKKGLDTMLYKNLSEDGVEVSGGEAQKIAIARALYKDAPFIILDEPTAALDPIAEAEIYSKFDEIAGNKTAIYISHRLSSCKFCDEIAVFHEGAVIQQGSHAELLADRGGKYYALWNAQAQYYTE